MQDAIQAGHVSAVIVKDVSRLGRDYLKAGHFIERLFPMHNVRFIAISGGIDSNTTSMDFLPLYSVMDEWYARDISRKLKTMYQARAAKGEPIGIPVYGYTKLPEAQRRWEPDPNTAVVVQKIYHLALFGYGVQQIASMLEIEKILTPAHYRISKNGKCGRRKSLAPYKWASSTVAQILSRQECCGDVVNLKTYSNSLRDSKRRKNSHNKMVVLKDVHEPIIERPVWEHVQQKRANNRNTRKARKQSLFSGFLRCGDCGSNLHYHFNQGNPSIEYYNCSNYVGNRGTCPDTHYVRLDFLKRQVLEEINKLLSLAHDVLADFTASIEKQCLVQARETEYQLNAEYRVLAKRQEELTFIIAQLYEDKISGNVDGETYSLLSMKFKSERGDNRQKSQQLQEQIQHGQTIADGIARFTNVLTTHSQTEELTREVIHELVDYISIYPAIRNGKEYTQKIEISYIFIGKIEL